MAMTLSVQNCTKSYRIAGIKRKVLESVSLSVEAGEIVSIAGKSGSGKTTLLNVISGIVAPDAGRVYVGGRRMWHGFDPLAARMRNREIGFVFQTFRLLGNETVLYNVMLPARLRGRAGRAIREHAHEVMEKLQIAQFRDMKASVLSGGQKQRVAIARALVNRPALVLADEPTANLDRETADEIVTVLAELKKEGRAVLVATHDEAMHRRSDRLYHLSEGVLALHAAESVSRTKRNRQR